MDRSDKTPEQPRAEQTNGQAAHGRGAGHLRAAEQPQDCAAGLASPGKACGDDHSGIRWTRDAVDRALAPFVALSKAVPGNRRKAHVPGGGGRRSGELWVDAYSGIKANGLNYVLNCFIEKKGDDPIFALFDWGAGHATNSWRDVVARADRVFEPGQLAEALDAWREVAARAGAQA